ncbi:uncharacterized protein TRIADDRAFT_27813 [Trichoplax adhaerens]|uniref:Transporter n=1 Tax=Trichoplax adhaerens TaxID=10228 RepID=B3S1L0_TRIAD|nr:hypothetical protein TRIADDRAFT_27813 [Trichoplax adhaerens]EDV23247.1 hypothetical protein TRIADDRAFT_27813 [Trichoplax adhaerens]|eukprot:XP_002114157.1 hypothetical protein TRIADDRAFT_27813 [Trichoplax adhaerens]
MADTNSDIEKEKKIDEEAEVAKPVDSESVEEEREGWGKKIEFLLCCVGYAVGVGNVLRFPYLCYENGGGAFLIPYFLCMIFCGIPLIALEFAIGQYWQKGPTVVFLHLCPLLSGIGYCMIMISFLVSTYYISLLVWVLYYLFSSFGNPLPWLTCDNPWNTPNCVVYNRSNPNLTGTSPSEEFLNEKVLNMTSSPSEIGIVKWDLVLLLLLSWIIIYFCSFKGVQWTGKVVYFTATFPYLVLIILFIRGLTLEGAGDGLYFYLSPKFELLRSIDVWKKAGTQIFYSLGIGFGSLIAYSSYNKRDNNVIKDAVGLALINCGTSFFAGFAIFSMMGHMSRKLNVPVERVVAEGPGLAFIIYPAGLATLPAAQFWSVLFFFMLITLALDSQFGMVESVATGIEDAFAKHLRGKKPLTVGVLCVVQFLFSIACVTQGGIYIYYIFDSYSGSTALILAVAVESLTISWIYGVNRMARNIEIMKGSPVWFGWKIFWAVITPGFMIVIFVYSIIDYAPLKYGGKRYPWWGDFIGWVMTGLCIISIIIPGLVLLIREKGTLKEVKR